MRFVFSQQQKFKKGKKTNKFKPNKNRKNHFFLQIKIPELNL